VPPIQGISSSQAAFSQAKFDQLKQQVTNGTVEHVHELHNQTARDFEYIPTPKTSAGPGGTPPLSYTPEARDRLFRQIENSGYHALSLGSAMFPETYQGHLLDPEYHLRNPVYGGLKVDFRL
jgi:hypothetical protein